MANYQEYMQYADETALSLTRNSQNWTAFLTTAARLYKYPYNEQLMIYAQRPDATACAEFDIWNKRMGRYIRRGSKGIMLADAQGARYVFDVADTGTRDKSKPFKLWEYSDEYEQAVQEMFADKYGSDNRVFFNMVNDAVRKSANEYWRDNRKNIIDIVANSFLEGYDYYNIKVKFIDAVSVSATYAVLSRCGFEPDEYFEHEDFLSIFDFNTVDTISELGTATSEINQQILRNIERTIKNYERVQLAERTENYGRTDLHEERGLLRSEPELSRNESNIREVRNNERRLSQEAQDGALEQNDTSRRADTAPERDRQDSERADSPDDAEADSGSRNNGGTENDRPTQMGGYDEQLQGASGGNNTERANIQLSLFPTENEQIKIIDEAESKNDLPFAFSISDADLENLLRLGSNTDNARMIIATEFSKNKGLESNAEFLKSIYHGGYGIKGEIDDFSAWYTDDGIHINRGTTARYSENAQIYSWTEIAEKITNMLDDGTFASNIELAEAPGFEHKQLAEKLWYMYRDISDEAKELGYMSPLRRERFLGFPEETADIADKLNIPEFRDSIITELTSLSTDYEQDKSLLHYHAHKPAEILRRAKELTTERIAYTSDMAEIPEAVPFITDDEIDMNLSGGSNIAGGKGRIYSYFTSTHTLTEKAAFLKNEYGIGGSSHSLSGASESYQDHSAKGISFKKGDCTEIQMSWNNVAKRITELVRTDKYLTAEEKQQYNELQRKRTFDGLYGEYNAVKEVHPSDMVLFQVGDFFEMFGEDAKAAAEVLEIYISQRDIKDVGKVDFCGVPSFALEKYVEKLREHFPVTISAIDSATNQRNTYSMAKLVPEVEKKSEVEQKTEITQADIEAFIKNWNGDISSKQRVNEYMTEHGRERGTAAWLANEYGNNADMFTVTYEGLQPVELAWVKVQRTLIQMVSNDTFLDENTRLLYRKSDRSGASRRCNRLCNEPLYNG